MEIVKQHEGADPAAVVFDAMNAAKARQTDAVLVDTTECDLEESYQLLLKTIRERI